jgi:23S rRNA G2069 N7-methylase RlmK/C1962 C5-methylase RlmI
MLANRLRKNARHLGRWARREGVSCYRLYDCDIPELPLAVDRYGEALVVAWYVPEPSAGAGPDGADGAGAARPDRLTPGSAAWLAANDPEIWLEAMLAAIGEALDTPRARVHARIRAPQRGADRYSRLAPTPALAIVDEGGLRFEVDLAAHLDVGLFLDHRPLRSEVRGLSRAAHVLNLFAYTGAFSVHAAAGGAATTTSVDLNATYLAMAERNLALNGFADPARHALVRADVLAWLAELPPRPRFDLAVVDPPTFSNSKRMAGVFDIQRDHVGLLDAVLRQMRPGGQVFFSTNHRRFRPDFDALEARRGRSRVRLGDVTEITARTIPVDFRDKRIHRAFHLRVAP